MINPMQLIQLLKTNKSPKEVCMDMIGINTNPILKNLVEMAEKGDKEGVKNVARNIFKENGKDFDKEFDNFMTNFK